MPAGNRIHAARGDWVLRVDRRGNSQEERHREEEEAPEVFNTSPVRAVITDREGRITLLTDNSTYALEVVGR